MSLTLNTHHSCRCRQEVNNPCTICKESEMENPMTLQCGHCFCHDCISQWLSEFNHQCPICREPAKTMRDSAGNTALVPETNRFHTLTCSPHSTIAINMRIRIHTPHNTPHNTQACISRHTHSEGQTCRRTDRDRTISICRECHRSGLCTETSHWGHGCCGTHVGKATCRSWGNYEFTNGCSSLDQ